MYFLLQIALKLVIAIIGSSLLIRQNSVSISSNFCVKCTLVAQI